MLVTQVLHMYNICTKSEDQRVFTRGRQALPSQPCLHDNYPYTKQKYCLIHVRVQNLRIEVKIVTNVTVYIAKTYSFGEARASANIRQNSAQTRQTSDYNRLYVD